jgi:hypothetical protein
MPVSTIQNASLASGVPSTAKLPAGSVLQVVSTIKTNTFSTSSTSYVDITGFSVTITPTSSTSKILIMVSATIGPAANNFAPASLVRNSTLIAQPTTASTFQATLNSYPGDQGGVPQINYVINFLDSPATTSATTYKLQMYTSDGTAYFNTRPISQNGTTVSTITAMEIAA